MLFDTRKYVFPTNISASEKLAKWSDLLQDPEITILLEILANKKLRKLGAENFAFSLGAFQRTMGLRSYLSFSIKWTLAD